MENYRTVIINITAIFLGFMAGIILFYFTQQFIKLWGGGKRIEEATKRDSRIVQLNNTRIRKHLILNTRITMQVLVKTMQNYYKLCIFN